MGKSVNYFANLKAKYHFLKIRYNKSNFSKKWGVNIIYPKKNCSL